MTSERSLAMEFAKSQGFDGVCDEVLCGELPSGWYVAGVFREHSWTTVNIWPLIDNTPHVIIVDATGAHWRSKEDECVLKQ